MRGSMKGGLMAVFATMIASVYSRKNDHLSQATKEAEVSKISKMQATAMGGQYVSSPAVNQRKVRKSWRQNPHTRPAKNRR